MLFYVLFEFESTISPPTKKEDLTQAHVSFQFENTIYLHSVSLSQWKKELWFIFRIEKIYKIWYTLRVDNCKCQLKPCDGWLH